MSDFEGREPVLGLPERLPEGETLLWQGASDWRVLARRLFRTRLVMGYFVFLGIWRFLSKYGAAPVEEAIAYGAAVLPVCLIALGLLYLLAWLTARTTAYTITNRRVAMRFGIALPMTINVPFAQIDTAALKLHANGSGDIPLTLSKGDMFTYVMLWPHVRPGRIRNCEPMLRGLKDAQATALILSKAMKEFHGQDVEAPQAAPSMTAKPDHSSPRGLNTAYPA